MRTRIRRASSLVSIPATVAAALALCAPPAAAQQDYVGCGQLIDGVTCPMLFADDNSALWLLDNYGGFQIGDRVLVTGSSDPSCPNICNQGNGCIYLNTIELCDVATTYCFCPNGEPCGNPDPSAGCANSTSAGAVLAAAGSGSVASDDLVIAAAGLPPNQSGIIYMGAGQIEVPFGDGFRCVGAGGVGVFRFPVRNARASGSFSESSVVGHSHANFPPAGQIQAGDTWNFQAWYRDPGGPCGSTFNFSRAVSVSFSP